MPSTAISAQGTTFSIGSTTGSALTISAVTLTNPCRVTLSAVTGLSKGDVITIPAKTPHWFKEVPSKTVAYYAVNIDSE